MTMPPAAPKKLSARIDKAGWVFWALLIAFILAASITMYLAFKAVQEMVLALKTPPPEAAIYSPDSIPMPGLDGEFDLNSPLQAESGPPPKAWDGESRVTVLLLGLDYRQWEAGQGPPLADTVILLTFDPVSQTAGMLSIPRDLWVDIPGYGYKKINQTFQLGEAYGDEGGGAGLAMRTVAKFLDIPIDYYVQVDFNTFVTIVDELGGVKIDVPERIEVDPLGDHNTILLKTGVQTLPGDIALAYARARNTPGSDFDRAARQQQVILGIRDRVVDFQMLPSLIARSPAIYQAIASGVRTNLTLQQIIQLAWLAQQIDPASIHRAVIGADQVTQATSPEGMSILQPILDEILILRDQVFSAEPAQVASDPAQGLAQDDPATTARPAPLPTPAVAQDPGLRMKAEEASMLVLNGTYTAGLAGETYDFLLKLGLLVTEAGNADQYYEYTTLIDHTGNPNTITYLAELLSVPPDHIYSSFDPDSEIDVTIILGGDWAETNPLP